MIKYNKVYRGQFYNQEREPSTNLAKDIIVTVDIYDTTSGEASDPTEIIELSMCDNPVISETVDNEEDKFKTIIRSLRATVNIFSSGTIGIETFIDGGDSKFFGVIYNDDNEFIRGFLSVADIQEDFQPDPNIISLIITDGLGFTSDEELTDEDGNIPTGIHNIWYYIRLALLKTGHSMPATVVFNIREKFANTLNGADDNLGHFFKYCYLDARTFEGDNPGTMITCSEVLERILFGCMLFQTNESWWIVNIDEIQQDSDYHITNIDEDGVFTGSSESTRLKDIGVDLELSWKDDDAVISSDRALKRFDLKRMYEYFKEIPCNIDFERGAGSDPTGISDETIDYTLECWDFLREGSTPEDLDTAPFIGSTGVLRKRFEFNYEKERYLVNGTAGGFRHYFKSQGIHMAEQAKIRIGIQFRSATDTAAVTMNVAHMRLVGDDGNVYDWRREYDIGTKTYLDFWDQKVTTDTVFDSEWQVNVDGINEAEWQSVSGTSLPVPVSGILYIRLINDLSTPMRHFSGLRVEYTPLVNGSYAKYTGERDTVEQTADAKGKREDELLIGSGPDQNVKGCLLKRGTDITIFTGNVSFGTVGQFETTGDVRSQFVSYIGQTIVISGSSGNDQEAVLVSLNYSIIGNITQIFTSGTTTTELGIPITVKIATFELAILFYNASVLPDGPTLDEQSKQYGEIISFIVWNQYNRVMRKFEGNIDGLDTDSRVPSFIERYFLDDVNLNSTGKCFMLLHFSQNLHLCEWEAFFIEVHDPANPKVYTGHSFKYLTE